MPYVMSLPPAAQAAFAMELMTSPVEALITRLRTALR
jgi:hypothetical protein